MTWPYRGRLSVGAVVLALAWTGLVLPLAAQPARPPISAGALPEDVGVREQLGQQLPLDVVLRDEQGQPVALRALIDRATLLLFVYYRCPGICDPLMREVAHTLEQVDLAPGKDYRVVLVSFDPSETPEVARTKKAEILATIEPRPPQDSWRFLTGPAAAVKSLTEAAGFRYRFDPRTGSYVHASSLAFVTGQGRIVRYLGGVTYVPAELKMALLDAQQGRQRSFMNKLATICYAFDPASRTYVLRLNRIILGVTAALVLGFIGLLLLTRDKRHG